MQHLDGRIVITGVAFDPQQKSWFIENRPEIYQRARRIGCTRKLLRRRSTSTAADFFAGSRFPRFQAKPCILSWWTVRQCTSEKP